MAEVSRRPNTEPASGYRNPMPLQQAKNIEIELMMEEGEPLGAVPNDKLIITKVQTGTIAEGKLQIGDQVLSVNGIKLSDTNSFFKALRFAPPCARITISRDVQRAEELAARVHIPADREKLIQRRDGFTYFVAKLVWTQGGPKLGLGIKHYQNRVLVSRCDAGSLAASQLQVGDHMIDIDGSPVTDKDVARDMLIKGLQARGCISSVIERPETAEAKHWTQQALQTQTTQPPSVQMNSDVRAIAARERAKLKDTKPPVKSILVKGNHPGRVQIADAVGAHIIASDHEGRALRSVKK